MRCHDDQVATSGLCCFGNSCGWVRIWNVHGFCSYTDLLRHSLGFIEHFARAFLASRIKAFKLCLCGNPSGVVDWVPFCYGDDGCFGVQSLCQGKAMLNAFSRNIRTICAQQNIGVHSGTPLLHRAILIRLPPSVYSAGRRIRCGARAGGGVKGSAKNYSEREDFNRR
jgi:hypothetical protein